MNIYYKLSILIHGILFQCCHFTRPGNMMPKACYDVCQCCIMSDPRCRCHCENEFHMLWFISMRLLAGAFKSHDSPQDLRLLRTEIAEGNPNSNPNTKRSPECLKLVTITSVRLSVCLCAGVDNVHGNQRVMVHENTAHTTLLMSSASVPAPGPAPSAGNTLWQWQDVSYPIASRADILNINTTSLSLAFNFQPSLQFVQSGPDLSATLARWNIASHLTVDTLTPARDAHKIICTGWGNQVSGTWWRQDDRMRMNLGLVLLVSVPSFLGVVLHSH